MDAAEKADWYDNVTVLLCQILDGAKNPVKNVVPHPQELVDNINKPWYKTWGKGNIWLLAAVVVVLCAASFFLGKYAWNTDKEDILPPKEQTVQKADTTRTDTVGCQPEDGQGMDSVYTPPSQEEGGRTNGTEQGNHPVSERFAEWGNGLLQKLDSVQQEVFDSIKTEIIKTIIYQHITPRKFLIPLYYSSNISLVKHFFVLIAC